jgi:hypothetical protein
MLYTILKFAVTAALIVSISEIGKRNSLAAAILASVPLVSVMAMIWLYLETRDAAKVASLARSIAWLVVPSLALFLSLPVMLARGYNFYASLGVSIALTVASYALMIVLMRHLG